MGHGALREEHRVQRRAHHGRDRDGSFATWRASLQTPSSANAATSSIAVRVTAGVNPLNFHQNASHSITSGGCALERVVCGIRDPVSKMSRAAGTKYPASSQKYGRRSNGA